jgi:hypothetical protein
MFICCLGIFILLLACKRLAAFFFRLILRRALNHFSPKEKNGETKPLGIKRRPTNDAVVPNVRTAEIGEVAVIHLELVLGKPGCILQIGDKLQKTLKDKDTIRT